MCSSDEQISHIPEIFHGYVIHFLCSNSFVLAAMMSLLFLQSFTLKI